MEHDTSEVRFQRKNWDQSRQLLRDNVRELREHVESCKELNQRLETKAAELRQILSTRGNSKMEGEYVEEGTVDMQKSSDSYSGNSKE
ncbi:hypothetical protein GpartN1_g2440.t1 [Galdieria partita]|uniref:Uncharacterized protein n=1 Tax=Galdieria partita TaxID=83374 RepID=A0A9C7PUF4_9RHOD|nr:hypothetical protein GpartN1_g2440.t1 [Galdieria partita]